MREYIERFRYWLGNNENFTFYLIGGVIYSVLWAVVSIEFAILVAVLDAHHDVFKIRKNIEDK